MVDTLLSAIAVVLLGLASLVVYHICTIEPTPAWVECPENADFEPLEQNF